LLETLEIKNFQRHKNTKYEFVRGINVLTGQSDAGKTSTLRALELLSKNRPRGLPFRPRKPNETKEPTEIAATFDGITATRIRSKNINQYTLSTIKEPFDVVGTNVPEEISTFLNLNDDLIQGQHDPYFLIQNSSSGEVAKKLNKVAGFEIIDQVMKSVKSAITKNTTDIKYTESHIAELEGDIKQYEHLEGVEEQLNILQNKTDSFQEKNNFCTNLIDMLDEIENINEAMVDLDEWIKIETIIQPMSLDIVTLVDIHEEVSNLLQILDEINTYKTRMKTLSARADCEVTAQDISKLVSERDVLLWTYNSLITALQNIEKTKELQVDLTGGLEIQESKLNKLLKEYKICPTCGTKLTTTTIEYIKESI